MATPKLNPTFIDKNNLDPAIVNEKQETKSDEQLAMEATFAENQKLKEEVESLKMEKEELKEKLGAGYNPVLKNEFKSEQRRSILKELLTGASAAGQLYGPTINQQALDKALTHYIGLAEIIVERITKRWN